MHPRDGALTCLSVRSALDLALSCLALPQGGEVLVSAVTIKHMVSRTSHIMNRFKVSRMFHAQVHIIEFHGLIPIAIDIDPHTLAPCLQQLKQAVTSRTVAICVSAVFGALVPFGPATKPCADSSVEGINSIADVAHAHDLWVFEDCAEYFVGQEYKGSPHAHLSFFSFGTIKTATALGAAVVRVRAGGQQADGDKSNKGNNNTHTNDWNTDGHKPSEISGAQLLCRMNARLHSPAYPQQTVGAFTKKLVSD